MYGRFQRTPGFIFPALLLSLLVGSATVCQGADETVERVTADGEDTPVLVQLTHRGEMLAGRYQATLPGIFVTPPWTTDLAPGPWQLRISRGPQFRSLDQTFQCTSGETIELGSLELTRDVDLPKLGWYGGDGDGDVYHGEAIYKDVNAETAADIAQAMGLDWVGVGRWAVGTLGRPNPATWGEAREFMRSQSHSRFLFMWTDERPKSQEGHAPVRSPQQSVTDTRSSPPGRSWWPISTAGPRARPCRAASRIGFASRHGPAGIMPMHHCNGWSCGRTAG